MHDLIVAIDPKYRKPMRWNEFLARLPEGKPSAAEIGVWQGGTSERVLEAHPGLFLHLVDPWETAAPGSSYATSGSTNAHRDHEQPFAKCMRRIRRFAGRFAVHRMSSVEAAKHVTDASLDLVFIDGDHSYAGVSTDIAVWLPKVKPQGYIGGHDFGKKKHYFPGVERAVRESFGKAFELGGDSTWWHRV